MLKIRQLAIALLTSEYGINEESYNLLVDLLEGDEDITDHVEATDGGFYLPEGWVDEQAGTPVGLGYMQKKVSALGISPDIQTDNGDQLVIYTGLMLDGEGHVVDWVDPEDESFDEDDEPQDEEVR